MNKQLVERIAKLSSFKLTNEELGKFTTQDISDNKQ